MYHMDFERYQREVKSLISSPNVPKENVLLFWAVGLSGEAGEVANIVKKLYYPGSLSLDEFRKRQLIEELGDTLWYVSALASECGLNLQAIAYANLDKVAEKVHRELEALAEAGIDDSLEF